MARQPRTASIRSSGRVSRGGMGRVRVTTSPGDHWRRIRAYRPGSGPSPAGWPLTASSAPAAQAGIRSESVQGEAGAAARTSNSTVPSHGYSVVTSSSTGSPVTVVRTRIGAYWCTCRPSSELVVK